MSVKMSIASNINQEEPLMESYNDVDERSKLSNPIGSSMID